MIIGESQGESKIKVILVGMSFVGKTSFFIRYFNGSFGEHGINCIGIDFSIKRTSIDGHHYKVQLWDQVGQSHFRQMTSHIYRGATAALICFALNDRASFERAMEYIDRLKDHKSPAMCVLVGMKSDLLETMDRCIPIEDCCSVALTNGLFYTEVSAKANIGVQEVMSLVINSVHAQVLKENQEKTTQC